VVVVDQVELVLLVQTQHAETFQAVSIRVSTNYAIQHNKISFLNLKLTTRTTESENFKHFFLRTMILHLQTY